MCKVLARSWVGVGVCRLLLLLFQVIMQAAMVERMADDNEVREEVVRLAYADIL